MTFAWLRQAPGARQAHLFAGVPAAPAAPDARLAEVEKNLDRTSDAFIEALNLLDRCLPPSFSA
jgi:hypothetical protein